MKKHFLIVTLVLVSLFTLGAFQFAAAKSGKPMKLKPAQEEELILKEREVWEAYRVRDAKALDALLAEDFSAIEDVDGEIMTKKEALDGLNGLDLKNFQMENFKVVGINEGSAIVRYKVKVTGAAKLHAMTSHWSLVSSVWVKRGGKWLNLSYQETWIEQEHGHAQKK